MATQNLKTIDISTIIFQFHGLENRLGATPRGFESHPLRQNRSVWRSTQEAEEDGLLNR